MRVNDVNDNSRFITIDQRILYSVHRPHVIEFDGHYTFYMHAYDAHRKAPSLESMN